MTKLYTDCSLRKFLILCLLALPVIGFSRVIGGPDNNTNPDSVWLSPLGHLECNIHTDTNCVTKMIQLEAWIDYTFTGISQPVTVPWSNGVTAHKIIVTPPGTWSWDVTGIGCEPVHQNNFITIDNGFFSGPIDILGPLAICPFEQVELTVNTLGYTAFSDFTWSPAFDEFSPYPINLPGTYKLTVTDAFGCPFTDQITIPLVPPFVPQITGTNIICPENDTTILQVTNGYFNYSWNNGEVGNPLTVTEPGIYEVTATDQYGCTGVGFFGVQSGGVDGVPITVTSTALCPGQLDTLRVQGGFSQYNWSNNVNGITNIVNQAGTYTVTVTNIHGCTGTASTTITPILPPVISITTTPLCPGGTATLTTIGGPFPTYHWNNNQNTSSITVNATGTYSVTVSGTGVCATSTNVVIALAAVPTTNIAPPNLLTCATTQITLDASTSSAGANFPLNWTTQGGNFVSGNNTLTPVVDKPGTYILSITNLTTGCITNDTVVVNQNTLPPGANAGPPATLTCTNQSLVIGPIPAPVDPNLSAVWTTSNGTIVSGDSTWAPTISQLGTYNLVVTNAANSCTSSASVVINQDITNPIAAVVPPNILTCTQSTVALSGTGSSTGSNFTYQWSTTNGTLNGPTTNINAVAASVGTYTLQVTNTTNGCTSSTSVTVSADINIPVVSALPPAVLTCDVPSIIIDASASSTGTTFQYNWTTSGGTIVNGGNTLTPEVSGPGTYTLNLLNTANNCAATLGVNVTQDIQPPVANAGPLSTLNCTVASLQLDGSASDSGPNFTYLWSTSDGTIVSGDNTVNPTVSLAGTYVLTVTNLTNGCTSTASTIVQNDANAPVALIAPPAVLTCTTLQTTVDATASTQVGNVTYVWTGPGIASGQNTLQLGVNLPGTYNLVITNLDNGCTDDASIVVNQDVVPPVAVAGSDVLINCFTPTGSLGSAANPSGAGFTLAWTTVGGNFTSGVNGPTATINQAGTYQLLITNTQNGCTDTDDVIVQADFVPPVIDAGPTSELTCVMTSVVLQSVGSTGANFSYAWSTTNGNIIGGADTPNPTVNVNGTYTVLVTNTTNGCTATDNVLITKSADIPDAVIAPPQILTCTTLSTTLNGSAGSSTGPEFTYAWTTVGGNISSNPTTLNPGVNAPGVYIVTVTNTTNNCTATASTTVAQNVQLPVVNAGLDNTLTCAVTSLPLGATIVSSSSTGISYVWGTTGGAIVNGGNTANPTINAPGTYSVTVTDAINGCTGTDLLQIGTNTTPPVALIGNPQTLTCTTTQISLSTAGSSTGANFGYVWSTVGGNIVSVQDPHSPVVNDPGVYNVVITNSVNGCTQTATVTVPEDVQLPTAEAGQTVGLDCDTQTNSLNGNGSSAGAIYTYSWTTQGGQIVSGNTTLTPTIGDPGTYTLLVTNTQNGCTQTDVVNVTEDVTPPAVTIPTPGVLTCTVLTTPIAATGSNLGTPVFAWTTTNGQIATGANTLNPTVNKPGVYVLNVVNNVNGCTTSASITVTQNIVPPTITVQPAPLLTCSVLQFPLSSTLSPQTTINWTTTNGHIVSGATTPTPVVDEPGTYQAIVTSQINGCTSTNQIPVAQETNLPTGVEFDVAHPLCNGTPGNVQINQVVGGVGPYGYSIDGGQTFFTFQEFSDLAAGSYSLVVQDANGCEIEEPITIIPPLYPVVTIPPSFSIELGENQELQAIVPPPFPLSKIAQVIWSPMDGLTFEGNTIPQLLNPTAMPFKTTEYTVTIITPEGCESVARTTIKVDREVDIYVPNVIWPEEPDGDNTTFQIFARDESVANIHKLQIFDRWGTLLFENKDFSPNDLSNGWDGTFKGEPVNPAVFVWWAEVELIDGRKLLLKGDVTVVR